jgi:hypothetical protein
MYTQLIDDIGVGWWWEVLSALASEWSTIGLDQNNPVWLPDKEIVETLDISRYSLPENWHSLGRAEVLEKISR